jgi:hypothetical protein
VQLKASPSPNLGAHRSDDGAFVAHLTEIYNVPASAPHSAAALRIDALQESDRNEMLDLQAVR